jgi:hypothetical protein
MEGWTFSHYRKDEALRHHLLIPFDSLKPWDKKYDLEAIQNYPSHAKEAGYKIVRVE